MRISRRTFVKGTGLAAAAAAAGSAGEAIGAASPDKPIPYTTLETYPAPGTMRITFCGTWYTPRPSQACNSVFVEIGNKNNDAYVFDCGAGVTAKYTALGVPFSRMAKIFITHLHGDHTSDLFNIYCFGPSSDRKFPLEVWGPSGDKEKDGTDPNGTLEFCSHLQAMGYWHSQSFSFLPTGYVGGEDGYVLKAHELDYEQNPGLAYDNGEPDPKDRVVISHFPAIHARDGSISYKLEWNGWSMVFTGDTKPNKFVLQNANKVDVLIHEMTTPPGVWTTKQTGLTSGDQYDYITSLNQEVIDNSHTEQSAFGYILSQTHPRLAVATHFPDDPDLVKPALEAIRCYYPQADPNHEKGNLVFARDFLVLTLARNTAGNKVIQQSMAKVPDYPWWHAAPLTGTLDKPKYDGPLAQFSEFLIDNIIDEADYDPSVNACAGHGKDKAATLRSIRR